MFISRVIIKKVKVNERVCNIMLTFIYKNIFKKSSIMKVYKILLKL